MASVVVVAAIAVVEEKVEVVSVMVDAGSGDNSGGDSFSAHG